MKTKAEAELTELFAKPGARNPAEWAQSQIRENIPQLARFLFLREAWKLVVAENDLNWMREQLETEPTGPGGAIGPALHAVLRAGVRNEDLTTVVRVMQWDCWRASATSSMIPDLSKRM
jgi:hypothetical protein